MSSWRCPPPPSSNVLLEQLSFLWSNVDFVRLSIMSLAIEEGSGKSNNSDTHNSRFPSLAGNLMLVSVLLARLQIPSPASLASTILCCFLSVTVWTGVAVVGLHHVRGSSSSSSPADAPHSGLWIPNQQETALTSPAWSLHEEPTFRLDWSTEDNYRADAMELLTDKHAFCRGRFADIRRDLIDYSFHKIYTCQRQRFQDSLIEAMLGSTSDPPPLLEEQGEGACPAPSRKTHWIVFTAGVMGAGKSHTMKQLHEKNRFPLHNFVTVDPDTVRHQLPEFKRYVEQDPQTAGFRTRKEAGMISEILTEAALVRGQNVLVDGTLRNSTWYQDYFANLRRRYPRLQIGILHVTAPPEAVFARAESRAKDTGRVVPLETLMKTMKEVPASIEILSQKADFAVELRNPPDEADVQIVGMNWQQFENTWKQSCFYDSNKHHQENVVYHPRAA